MATVENLPNPSNLAFVEGLYEDYLKDPQSVSPEWRSYFEREVGAHHGSLGPSFSAYSIFNPPAPRAVNGHANGHATNGHANGHATNGGGLNVAAPPVQELAADLRHPPFGSVHPSAPTAVATSPFDMAIRQDRVDQLIRAYRVRGHMIANVDPLGINRPDHRELDPSYYKLTDEDMDRTFSSRTIFGTETLTLRQILERLRNTYCRSIGVEFMHIHDIDTKNWLQERMEGTENRLEIPVERQRMIYSSLTDATMWEEFIQKKFLGAKSFSLEGSESLIPLLQWTIERAAEHGVDEITLGMAHRGRLNVLANIMGKSPRQIFREFEDKDPELYRGRGDVKYHLGYSSDYETQTGKKVHLSLCFNPSHLEYVNTVVMGRVRAKQDRFGDEERERKMAVLIHGDAAFIGEGIVQETFNLSELAGYHVGGTVHVVVNNQIGFTTSPEQSRSTTYCTDVAKMLQIPIFHVNGEDPEAVAQVVNMALDFRARFQRDVVIDMYGYRKLGHNETDEPYFTQPVMYKAIASRPTVRQSYLQHLLTLGGLSKDEADKIEAQRREHLEIELSAARDTKFEREGQKWLDGYWAGYEGGPASEADDAETSMAPEQLGYLLKRVTELPEGFTPHPKLARLLQSRREMASGERAWDWGAAEIGAFASVLAEGRPVRVSGQDVERGTFSHRHAVVHDVNTGGKFMTLRNVANNNQGRLEFYNSPLSEAGVLGFEWGYSLDCPEGLIVWEAQFGDFVNVAQVIIDQFICSAEDKWKRLSGLVLLLPHGFEGQGPEHSSARMERFLMLASEDNMQIAQPTSPAQIFHLLRRQVARAWRKPLIVFSPKSLLRHPEATSTLAEVANGRFERVIGDQLKDRQTPVKRIVICSGKIYYELAKHRAEAGRQDVAILRLEQLYPLPKKALAAALEQYAPGTPAIWVQDEPENMGAWWYVRMNLGERIFGRFPLTHATRPRSASPATGSASSHRLEQQELIDTAFGTA